MRSVAQTPPKRIDRWDEFDRDFVTVKLLLSQIAPMQSQSPFTHVMFISNLQDPREPSVADKI